MPSNLKKRITNLLFLIALPCALVAQTTYYSRATGDWNNVNTWSTDGILQHGGAAAATVPGSAADDIVLIGAAHVVTVNQSATFATLTLDDDGGGGSLRFPFTNSAGYAANYTIVVTGNLTVNGGGTIVPIHGAESGFPGANTARTHGLEVRTNLTNAGSIDLEGTTTARRVNLTLGGATNSVISGAGTYDFVGVAGALIFNKSSAAVIIENQSSNFNPVGFLTWTAGRYYHNNSGTFQAFAANANQNIASGALQIDQGTVELYVGARNADYDVTIGGDMTVNGGTVIVGDDAGGADVGDLIVSGAFTMAAGTVRAGTGVPSGPTYSTDGEIVLNGSATITGGTIWTHLFWVGGTATISGAGTTFQAIQLDVRTTGDLTLSQLTANVGVSAGTDGTVDLRGAASAPRGVLTVNSGATLNVFSDGDASFQMEQASTLEIDNAAVVLASDAIDNDDALELVSGTDASNQTSITISNGGDLTIGTGNFGDWEDDGVGNFISISVSGAGSTFSVFGTGGTVITRDVSITGGAAWVQRNILTVGNAFTLTGNSSFTLGLSTAERLLTTNGTVTIGAGTPTFNAADWTLGQDAAATVTGGTIEIGYTGTNTGTMFLTGQASQLGATYNQNSGSLTIYGNADGATLEIREGCTFTISGGTAVVVSPNADSNNDVVQFQRSSDAAFPTTISISGGADMTVGTGTFGDLNSVTDITFMDISVDGAGSTLTINGNTDGLDIRNFSVTSGAVVTTKAPLTVNNSFTLTGNSTLTVGESGASRLVTLNGASTISGATTVWTMGDLTLGADAAVTVTSATVTVGHAATNTGTVSLTGEASAQGASLSLSGGTFTVYGNVSDATFTVLEGADFTVDATTVTLAPTIAVDGNILRLQGSASATHPTTLTVTNGGDVVIGSGGLGRINDVTVSTNIRIVVSGAGSSIVSEGDADLAVTRVGVSTNATFDINGGLTTDDLVITSSTVSIGVGTDRVLIVNDSLQVQGTAPSLTADNITINMDGHFRQTAGTVVVGSASTDIGSVYLQNETVSGAGGQLTISGGTFTVYGEESNATFEMEASSRLTMTAGTLIISPDIANNNNVFRMQNGTATNFTQVTLTGGADVVIGTGTFGDADDNAGGANSSISVSGNGTTFNAYGTGGTLTIGDLSVSNFGYFNMNNSLTLSDAFTAATSATVIIGEATAGTLTVNGLMSVNGAATSVSVLSAMTLNSTANINSGTVEIGDNVLSSSITRFTVAATGSVNLNGGTLSLGPNITSQSGANLVSILGSLNINGGALEIVPAMTSLTAGNVINVNGGSLTINNGVTVNVATGLTSMTGGNIFTQGGTSTVSVNNGTLNIATNSGLTTISGGGNPYNLGGTGSLTIGDGAGAANSAQLNIATGLTEELPLITAVNVMDLSGTANVLYVDADGLLQVGGANRGDLRVTTNSNTSTFDLAGGTVNITASLAINASGVTVTVSSGTLNIGTSASDGTNTLSFLADPSLPTSFVVNGGTVTVGDGNSAVTLGNGNNTPTIASGNYHRFEITGGDVNLNGRFDMNDRAARFVMSGGNLTVNPQGDQDIGGNNNVMRFYRGAAVVTGGIITIVNPNPNAGGDGATTGQALLVRILGDGTTTDARLHDGTGGGLTSTFTGSDIRLGDGVSAETGSSDGFDLLLATDFTYSNITVNNPSGSNRHVTIATLPSNGTITIPNLTITAGTLQAGTAALPTSPNVLITGTGNFVLGAGGTMRIANTTNSAVPGGNPVNFPYGYASYSIGAGSTIEYSGNGSALVGLPSGSGETIENLTMSGTGTKAITAHAQAINGTLRLTSGTLNVGTNFTLNNGAVVLRDGTDALGIIGTGTLQQANATDVYTIRYEGVSKTTQTGEWVTGGTPGIADLYLNLTVAEILTLNTPRTVRDFTMNSGNFADGGFSLEVNRHLSGTSNSTHTGTGDIEITGGAATHNFSGVLNIEDLTMNDAGFNADMQPGTQLNVGGILTFTAGSIDAGDDLVSFDLNATVSGTPSETAMILTTGTTAQAGIQKTMQAGITFTFPFGVAGKYTPATITVTAAFSSGPVTVKTINGAEQPITQDPQNRALNHYWPVTFSGMTGVSDATLSFIYDTADLGVDGTETLYVPARYLAGTNPWTIAGTTTGVQENTPGAGQGTINFNNVGYLTGVYTAGESSEFNNATVVNYYSLGGTWDDVNSWSTVSYGGAVAGSLPAANTPVFIGNNQTITVDAGGATTISSLTIESTGILDVEVVPVTTFGTVTGTGTMRLHGNTFPSGTFTTFLGASGGTVEYRGAGNYTLPASPTNYRNLTVTGSGTTKTFPNADLQLYGNLLVNGGVTALLSDGASGDLNIDGNLTVTAASSVLRYQNTTARDLSIDGSVTVSTGATFEVLNSAAVANTLTIGSTTASSGNLTVTNGTFRMLNGTGVVDVTFTGTQDAAVTVASGGTPDPVVIFNRLIVNKGTSATPTLNVNCANAATNAFVISGSNSGATKALELQNGTFRVSAANANGTVDGQSYSIDLATGGGDFTIPSTAGLRVSGGSPVVLSSSGGDDLTLNGALTVDGTGTFIVGTITTGLVHNSVKYSSTSASLTLGGTAVMTVSTGVRANGTAALVFTQSGGTLTTGRYARETGEPSFEITNHANSRFNASGGTIVVVRGGTNDSESTQILSTTNTVSGGTLQITNANSPTGTNHRVRLASPVYNISIPLTTFTAQVDFNTYDTVVQNDFTLNVAAAGSVYFQDGEDLSVGGTLTLTSGVLNGTNNARTLTVNNYVQSGGTFSMLGTNVASNFNIAGNFSKTAGNFNLPTATGTVTFNGTSTPQTVASNATLNFNNVVLNNSATSGVIQLTNCDLNVTGNWTTTAGDLDAQTNARTVNFTSSTAAQTITGTTTFYGLTINNTFATNTVTLASGILSIRSTVGSGGTLTFTAGFLDLGNNSLIIRNTDAAAVSGATSTRFIRMGGTTSALGVTKYYPESASDFTFPIGTGTDYTPARINATSHGTSSGHYVRVRVIDAVQPVATSANTLSRYWDVDGTNWSGAYSIDKEFTYVDADLHLAADESLYEGGYYIPTTWTQLGDVVTDGSNLITFAGLTTITADYTAGYNGAFGLVTVYYSWGPNGTIGNSFNWAAPTNNTATSPWSGAAASFIDISANGAPSASSPVVIQRNHTITITADGVSTGDLSFDNTNGMVMLALGTTIGHNLGTVSGAGTIQLATGTLPGGTFTDFNNDGGVFEFTSAGALTIPSGTYRNLTISGAGTKTVSGAVTVQGDLTLSANAVLDLDANTANRSTLGGTMTMMSGSSLLLAGTNNFPANYSTYSLNATSTVTYDAAATQTIAARTYGNLVLSTNGTFTKTLAGSTVIQGNLTLTRTGGNPVFATANHALSIAGNIAIGQTQTVWSSGTSTITMNGSGAQTITRTGGGAITMQGLTINNAAGVSVVTSTAATNITVSGVLTLTNGAYSIGGAGAVANSLTLSGTVSSTAGTITGGNVSDLTLSGTGAVGTINFTAGGRTIRNFVMNRTAGGSVTLGTDLSIGTASTGTLTLTAGVIEPGSNTVTIVRSDTDVFNGANGSTSSYIDGRLAITYPAAGAGISRRFPVAQDGIFRPVTISGSPVNALIRVEVVNSAPTVTTKESALVTISTIRYFNVRLISGTMNNPSTVTLFFNVGNEDESVNDPGDLRIGRSTNNADWTNVGGTGSFTAKVRPRNEFKAAPEGSVVSGSSASIAGDTYYAVSSASSDNPLPVELMSLSILPKKDAAVVNWLTATETDHYGFFLHRKWIPTAEATNVTEADTTWKQVYTQLGTGNSFNEKAYTFEDNTLERAGKYLYKLLQQDFNGVSTIYGPYEFVLEIPEVSELFPNYPNPFNPETVIPFSMKESGNVSIQLYDLTGRKVMDVVNRNYSPGRYRITVNASRLSSGIYLVRLVAAGEIRTRKITLMR